MIDPFDVLDLPRDASAEEIKRAFRRLVKRHHPDLHPDDRDAEERLKEINEAYAQLSGKKTRTRTRLERGGCKVFGGSGKIEHAWGIVENVRRQGVGLYNVFLSTARPVVSWTLAVEEHSNAKVTASIEYQADRMVRLGVWMILSGDSRADRDFTLELGVK